MTQMRTPSVREIEAEEGVDYRVIDRPLDPSPETIDDEAPRSRIGQYILGGCVAVIAIALATSVFAGNVYEIYPGSTVSAFPADVGYVVEFDNAMSPITSAAPFMVDVDGQEVRGYVRVQSGKIPDDLFVTPPVGFYCDPCAITVEEFKRGQVFIYPQGMM